MLCSKCQKNEATLYFTTIVHGKEEETMQLCQDCENEATGNPTFDPSKVEVLPIISRKCEICGQDAFSGKALASERMIYWCFGCEAEYRRIFGELFIGEHREFMESVKRRSFAGFLSPEEFQAWSAEAGLRVVQIMKERRLAKE